MKCGICNSLEIKELFYKKGSDNQTYAIIQCKKCKVVQTFPKPAFTNHFYQKNYFEKRTDRGYDNYISKESKEVLIRTWELNLKDLNFFDYENELFQKNKKPTLLEIGCAGGFFLEYMLKRGWFVEGVEISKEMTEFAKLNLNLNVWNGDFIQYNSKNQYDCIVMWATIEHFFDPIAIFKKISTLLKKNGIFIFSTCRWGFLAKIKKENWRFMNVPEHLYFFQERQLVQILETMNFNKISSITYGSGFTRKTNMGIIYKTLKFIFDKLVKKLNMGDMVAMMFKKA
ncbi:MAG: class I SAM-dependent methyltransferase [Leptonema sp. (in: bacteria)]